MSSLPCILCNRNGVDSWFTKTVRAVEYPIVRCEACKSAYTWPRPNDDVVQDLYSDSDYNPNHNDQGLYWPSGEEDARRIFSEFGPHIRGRVFLDIGAGAGIASWEALRRGFTVRACEPSPQCQKEFEDRNGFVPEASFFDHAFAERNRNQVDAALLSHVLEHLPNPDQIMIDVRTVLRPGGVIMIAVPLFGSIITSVLGKRDFFVTPPEHLNYFSLSGLKALLERHGFSIVSSYSSSKVNMLRYKRLFGPACYAFNGAAYGVLRASELFKRSVVINVCARNAS
ncbi:MAG TPA: class I SAM-dependent methyltransferase [Terracidiphilus sp.]|nr:class I SAM-dependent methyltransferase [Terracidiphilus sp.]